jgi:hypothetical protein
MRTLSQSWQKWVIAALAATWLAAQNVGIGTTTPLTRLHVAAGDVFLGDAAGNNGFVLHSRAHAGYDFFQISTRTGGSYEWSKGITLVRNSGNVGIGTTTPIARLHVAAGDIFLGDATGGNGFILYSRSLAGYDFFQISTRTGGYEWNKGITLVRSTGHVGIGTTTPLTRLHVAEGDIFLGEATRDNGFILHTRNWAGYDFFQISTRTGGSYEWSKGITLVRSSGNVGIGTTNPGTTLEVAGTITAGLRGGGCWLIINDITGARWRFCTGDYDLAIQNDYPAGTWSTKVLIDENGNVGIGTTTPLTTLHAAYSSNSLQRGIISSNYVNSGVGGKIFILKGRGTVASPLPVLGGDQLGVLAFGGYFGTGVSDFLDHAAIIADATENWSLTSRGSRLRFTTTPNGSNTPQTRVIIDQNGNVGIGTAAPVGPLHIGTVVDAGANSLSDAASLVIGDYNGYHLELDDNEIHAMNNTSVSTLYLNHDGGNVILIGSGSGNVGIGTTSPAYRLHVVGDVYATGTVYCNGSALCSDQRWKTNIKPIQNALDNVLKMQGVTYYWKVDEYPDKHFPKGEQIGFIAQEIEKVYPQVVLTDKDGYKSVDYSRLTPILVEAIKEQQKIIEELQKVIQQLQEENSQIKQANAQLSAEIKMLNEKVDNLIDSLSNDKKLGYR